jgi:hypothetical protein
MAVIIYIGYNIQELIRKVSESKEKYILKCGFKKEYSKIDIGFWSLRKDSESDF